MYPKRYGPHTPEEIFENKKFSLKRTFGIFFLSFLIMILGAALLIGLMILMTPLTWQDFLESFNHFRIST